MVDCKFTVKRQVNGRVEMCVCVCVCGPVAGVASMHLEGCMEWCTGCAHALEALAAQVAEAISDDSFPMSRERESHTVCTKPPTLVTVPA